MTAPRRENLWLNYQRQDFLTDVRLDSYGIESSKSTGKLPLVLSTPVFFPILHALLAVRAAAGLSAWFGFDASATAEKIELACSPCSGRSA